jgi:hypothetical protein
MYTSFGGWESDYGLAPNEEFVSYIMTRTSYFQWNDDVHFALDQRTELELHSATWLKQQSADTEGTPLGHIILIRCVRACVPGSIFLKAEKQMIQFYLI